MPDWAVRRLAMAKEHQRRPSWTRHALRDTSSLTQWLFFRFSDSSTLPATDNRWPVEELPAAFPKLRTHWLS